MTTTAPAATTDRHQRLRWVGLGVLALALSMIVLDGTIVGVALPVIVSDLHLNLTDAQWVNSVYSVIFAALLLASGRLGDRLGRRRLLILGVLVFVGGSLLASGADSASALIWARIVQGAGGALVLPSTLSTVNATFRGQDRTIAFGVWGAVMSGMAAAGPLLGGWLTSSFSWRWIFLVNVPLGVLVLIGTLWAVPESSGKVTGRGLDIDGFQLSALGLGAIVFAIIEGSTLGWWKPLQDFHLGGFTWPRTWPVSIVPVLAVVGVVLLALFVRWERHRARVQRSAILDLGLFRVPTFSWGNITAATVAIGEFAIVFVLPLYLVNALGLSVLDSGFVLATMAGGAFISGAMARRVAERLTPAAVVVAGLVLEVIGIAAVGTVLGADTSPWLVALLLIVYGVGLGLASAQLTSTVLRDVPTDQSGQGSATQSTVRQVGAAIGAAVAGAVLSVGLGHTLTSALGTVAGLGQDQIARTAAMTRSSAGTTISMLREQGAHSQFGEHTGQVVHALAGGFGQATQFTLFAAAAFLLLGVIGALRVRTAAAAPTDIATVPFR